MIAQEQTASVDLGTGICTGCSDSAPAPSALEALAEAQALLARAAPGDVDSAITAALEKTARALGADRAYVFAIRDMVYLQNTHEWSAPGIPPIQTELKETPYSAGDVFHAAFSAQGALRLRSLDDLPTGSELHTILMQQKVKSLIAVPIHQGTRGQISGFAGVDFCKAEDPVGAGDTAVLHCLATSIGTALDARGAVHQRQRLRADLADAERRLSAVMNAMPKLLIELDHDGCITGFFQSPDMTFALFPEEVFGLTPEHVLPAHAARICRMAMAQVDATGQSDRFPYSLTINGMQQHYWLQVTARHGTTMQHAHGYLFVVKDVTQTRVQEMQIRQLARVAELSNSLIMLTDKDRRITWINPACAAYTGTPIEQASGRYPSEILRLRQVDRETVHRLGAMLDRGDTIDEEISARSPLGTPYWLRLNVQPLCDEGGAIQGYMVVGNDVTRHKLAETRARRDHITAMDASLEGIAISRLDGGFEFINRALRETLAIPAHVPAEDVRWDDGTLAPARDTFSKIFPEVHRQGSWRGDIQLPAPDGTIRHVDVSIAVQEDGKLLSLVRDITARKAAERDLALLREQLQVAQSRQLVARIAGGLAHDLVNILAAITHASERLKPSLKAEGAVSLGQIETATRAAQSLVHNMAKLGQRRIAQEHLDLRQVVRNAATLVTPSLGNDISLKLKLPTRPVETRCDRTEVMQIILNLVINARDAVAGTVQDARAITVQLSRPGPAPKAVSPDIGTLCAGRAYARITIDDTGPGMDEHLRAQMFIPYFSTKGNGGTGLGLSIVADIISANEGALQVRSRAGSGSQVTIYWPVVSGTIEEYAPCLLAGMRILVIDSDETALAARSQLLTAQGGDVISCPAPGDALRALKAGATDWDAIVARDDMPRMTAAGFLTRLRAQTESLPIILLASKDTLQSVAKSALTDQLTVLRQPVDDATLIASLAAARAGLRVGQ